MRLVTTLLLAVVLIASAASAEFLLTANPLGQGKIGGLLGYVSDANYNNVSGMSVGTIGGYVGYGITDKLDVLVNLGSANASGLPVGVSKIAATGYALNLKYSVIQEGKDMPVSVAVGGGYKSSTLTTTVTGLGDISTPLSQISIAAGVSKVMAPFIPYGALAYRSMNSNGTAQGTAIDLTVGSAIAWSMQGAVMIEATMQSITPNGGANYSSSQLAAGVAYLL
ncbi:MAG: hypothetical protein MUC35_02635 [Candidatus Margulisbacteria bacterium]|jgi:hypothetical protein|nr:hypothetical protein [Candidatus Margulisiibacteriota bacterium]